MKARHLRVLRFDGEPPKLYEMGECFDHARCVVMELQLKDVAPYELANRIIELKNEISITETMLERRKEMAKKEAKK